MHGVKLSAYARLTSVFQTALSANDDFHTPTRPTYSRIVNRICLNYQCTLDWSPGSLSRVGFHLLILLSVVLVFALVSIAPIETNKHWVDMHQNKSTICLGAVDGNRTHLSLADNESPSQRATTAYMVLTTRFELAFPDWKSSVLTK